MKLVAEAGLWTTGPRVSAPPAVAVLEVAGAVLEWTVDDPAAAAQLTFTDVAAAEWLWRVAGEQGHVALVQALQGRTADPLARIDVTNLELSPAALAPLRRLAVGHWLRRWWPAGVRDAIADLDPVVLAAELAVLTDAAQAFFTEDTLDSDIEGLLRPHRDALALLRRDGDPRVSVLAEACLELADWPDLAEPAAGRRRDDYALAAGGVTAGPAEPISRGTASISWSAVPPGIFDAAEDTVDWAVHSDGSGRTMVTVRTAITAPAGGVPVRVDDAGTSATGVLDDRGTATLALPIAESAAWNHDWAHMSVTVGTGGAGESRQLRDRLRAFARARLSSTPDDAFLAEVLAAESDY